MPDYQEEKTNKKFLSSLLIAIFLSTIVSVSASVNDQLCSVSVRENIQKIRVIIDTDPGIDDAIALMMALRSDNLQIEAITIVPGNVESELGSQNALKILEYMGRKDIPVAVGTTHPLKKPLVTDPHFHGTNGLGMVSLPTPYIGVIGTNAVDLIISKIMESPGEITLVTLGPLTNLAIAIEKEPAIIENVKAVVSMAGAVYVPGFLNNNNAEFNVFTDPEAAKIVFSSGIPIRMAGLEVCYKVKFTKELLDSLAGIDTRMAKLIVQMANYEVWKQGIESGWMILADPTAMTALLQPDIFESETIAVDVIVSGELEGKTIEDTASLNKMEILLDVDIEEASRLLLDLARVADDVSPPTITDVIYSPLSPTPYDLVVVSAKVTDTHSGVNVVNLLYSASIGGSWSSLIMTHSNVIYTATIPRYEDGKTIQFKISAEDYTGNIAESNITSYTVHALPYLMIVATANPATVYFGGTSTIKITLTSGVELVTGALINLASSNGGAFSAVTDQGNGTYIATYTAPDVATQTTSTISVTAVKSGYKNASGQTQLSIQSLTISISVKDSDGLVAGVTVTSTSQPNGQTALSGNTDQSGKLSFSNVLKGSYTFKASKSGYEDKTWNLNVQAGQLTVETITLVKQSGIPGYPTLSTVFALLVAVFILYSART